MADEKTASQQAQGRSMAMAIPTSDTGTLQPRNYGEAIEVAKLFAHSGMLPKQYEGNPGAVLVAMQMGADLGLSPMSALQSIAVINGRPSLWGDAMLAVVMAHRDFVDISETEGDGWARCIVKRRGRSQTDRVFTLEDAKKAQLLGKQGPWSQYPKRMLQLRARGFALRDAFPDALRGIISSEEARDYGEDAVDGGTPQYASAADIPEGTHRISPRPADLPPRSVAAQDDASRSPAPDSPPVDEKQPVPLMSEDLMFVLDRIEAARNTQMLMQNLGTIKKLSEDDKIVAHQAYRKKQKQIDSALPKEPGSDG